MNIVYNMKPKEIFIMEIWRIKKYWAKMAYGNLFKSFSIFDSHFFSIAVFLIR